ncbi:MAG: hypothetical protein AAB432_03010 [Patescibacteria group bacterium]
MKNKMEVIPVINCPDFECVQSKLDKLENLGNEWIHVDVADGSFTPYKNWHNSKDLKTNFNIEVHLMVKNPEAVVGDWLKAGAKRIIVHVETLDGPEGEKLQKIFETCAHYDAEIMLASNPDTLFEELIPYFDIIFSFQCLAVSPGPAGQKFDSNILEKIKLIRERLPDALIEIDGGINREIAKLVNVAGADIVAAGTYIFSRENMKTAYDELQNV